MQVGEEKFSLGKRHSSLSSTDHYLYSGDKKHVMAGIAIIGVVIGVPWYFMNKGSRHQSHQDYMDRADKARRERLSKGSSTASTS